MTISVTLQKTGQAAILTTDHARSNLGQPVLMIGRAVYGAGDGEFPLWVLDARSEACDYSAQYAWEHMHEDAQRCERDQAEATAQRWNKSVTRIWSERDPLVRIAADNA